MRYLIFNIFILALAFSSGCTALAAQGEDTAAIADLKNSIEEEERLRKEAEAQHQKQKEAEDQKAMESFLNTELKTVEPLGIKARPVSPQIAVTASAQRYRQSGAAEPVIAGENLILYPYGLAQAKLACAFLTTCSIELQEGEHIQSKHPGDSQRWWFGETATGTGSTLKPVVIVKPLVKEELFTNLIILTDRRIYYIHLKSVVEGPYTPRIGFFYPQEEGSPSVYGDFSQSQAPEDTNEFVNFKSIAEWNFNYRIKGKKGISFYPQQVFDDGKKVYIRMPEGIEFSEIPVFFGLGPGGAQEVVNYRYKDGVYIIDRLIKSGVLLLNTNGKEEKITIIKL